MNHRTLSALLLLGAGCATTQAAKETAPAGDVATGPKSVSVQLVNRSVFDVGTCQPPTAAPTVSNEGTVNGALLATGPLLRECLVDSRHRGPEKETTVTVDTTVTEAGAQHQVTGPNLTPEGTACVEAALARTVKLPPVQKGAAPVKGQLQLKHTANADPTVTWGVNEPSDIVGTLRLAQSSWCDCFASFTDQAPPAVKASFTVLKGTTSLSDIQWMPPGATPAPRPAPEAAPLPRPEPGASPGAPEQQPPPPPQPISPQLQGPSVRLAECLHTRMQQVQLAQAPTEDWTLPYTFEFIHSGAEQVAENASPELGFLHLEALHPQVKARTATASGEWLASRERFNATVTRYNREERGVTMKHLKDACGARVQAVEAWVAQLDRQLALEKRLAEQAQQLAARDAGWTDAATRYSKEATQTGQDRAQAQQHRETEAADCKRLK